MSIEAKTILDGINVEKIRVQRMTQCVLYGLIEPDVELTPEFNRLMAEAMATELRATLDQNPGMFMSRAKRAFQWSVRADIEAEFGIFMGEQVLALLRLEDAIRRGNDAVGVETEDKPAEIDIIRTPEYRAYVKKFKPVLDSVRSAMADRRARYG